MPRKSKASRKATKASHQTKRFKSNSFEQVIHKDCNNELEFDYCIQSGPSQTEESEYFPSQEPSSSFNFDEILEQLIGFFIEHFGLNMTNIVKRNLSVLICILLFRVQVINIEKQKY